MMYVYLYDLKNPSIFCASCSLRTVCSWVMLGIKAVRPLGTERQCCAPLSSINCGLVLDLTPFDEQTLHIRSAESLQAVTLLCSHFFQTYCIEHRNGVFVICIIP